MSLDPHSTNLAMSDDAPAVTTDVLVARSFGASLTVRDLSASVMWYRDVLGFTVEREYQRDGSVFAVTLRAGAAELLLGQDNGAKGLDRAKGEGFSLQLTTAQDIDQIAARIRGGGGALETEPADMWGKRAFRLRDPDGFRFTISSPRQA
jgi:uncharacterized glyoxalase superfamily protein PhnB